ncbi:MAG: hypothetical protein KGV51_02295 [Moraxellaceae bacterium]|nr:hypothetical protein [Moraxellaceae bacterium]
MSKHTSLTENEQAFLNKIQSLVANDDVMTDYDELISQVANNHNGRFWYECAMILQQMEEGMKLDMRDNGRLHVAWHIFNRLLESNPNIPQVWEGRINVLNYILAGYSARIRALANVEGYQQKVAESISRSKFIKKELLITLDIAIEKFADNNDWFIFEKKEFLEHYG